MGDETDIFDEIGEGERGTERERKIKEKRRGEEEDTCLSVVLCCSSVCLAGCGLTEATQIHDGEKRRKKRVVD